ncbi:SusC/RagA family TonB-linked outer membrane protein [Paraflavitalea sp. CAU 1676]|uniref:SusC/RagA family TonB-linked outer membrane protein n=1 Tax=Paraflavitalea sp. CAU 1676 TaxID=3032598 RepID=UPI0023DBB39E|nr:SusC/RagA family TonB-linked outer membrane protein [Paraflavitalea sp. CAU 1676]MDF2188705.1 SusC/RagA family TonB-linked outer membrane protein [Paraflavitalea sp. CAU 1676]
MKFFISIALACLYLFSTAQQISSDTAGTLTGKVVNDRGEPLVGVNITLRNAKGTVTDAQGRFSLQQIQTNDILQVSFVGYSHQRVPVGNNNTISIILRPADNYLDEVVVQAYGYTSRRLGTGSIARVTAEEIAKQPAINAVQVLQGRAAGVSITNVSGMASASVSINIRGLNGIDPNVIREPLYIIDGVPLTPLNISGVQTMAAGAGVSQGAIQSGLASPAGGQSPFFNINAADIESMEVLKDADATAIFGSRAANGAILVTMKKGKAGKTVTDLDVYTGFSKVTRFFPLLNTQQYVQLRKAALQNDGLAIDVFAAPDLVAWDTTRYTDWQRYAFGGTGRVVNAQLSISGGTAQTNFRAGAGYNYQQDIAAIRGGNQRGGFSIALQHKTPRQKLIIDLSAQYSLTSSDLIYNGATALLPPNAPAVFDAEGKLNYSGWMPIASSFAFGSLLQPYGATTSLLNSNLVVNYNLAKGWTARVNLGYNNSISKQSHTIPIISLHPDMNPRGSLTIGRTFFHNLISEPQVEYNGYIGKAKLSVLAGATYQANRTNGLLNAGSNYTSDLLLRSINAAPTKVVVENDAEYKYTGGFLRLSYSLLNRYIMTLNGRRDGSSRFGAGKRFGNFGSIGAAWIASEEDFMKKVSFISFVKLRGSYGVTGSDQIGDYAYLPLWEFGTAGKYGDQTPLFPTRFADSLLHWEQNRKLEAALQLGFFKDRINLEIAYYRNRCNNQLVNLPVATQGGFATVITNAPANVQNTGVEILASVNIVQRTDWQFTSRVNFSVNRNKLLSYPNFDRSPYKGRYVIGKPLNMAKYLHFTGVDPATGDYTFADLTGDGDISIDLTGNTADDRAPVILAPQFEGGVTTELSYRQWSLSVLFYYRKQQGFNALVGAEQPGARINQPGSVMNYWAKPGDRVLIGRPTNYPTTSGNNYAYYSDARISDASFIRLQNLAVHWNFPTRTLEKLHLTNLRVFLQGENLFLITRYKGNDPEVQQLGAMPRPAILTAGISCKL